jgi:ribose transport system ATP-binding protein
MEQGVILSINGLTKSFPGVRALNDIHLDIYRGEVHGIVGENGAGKSTMMKILSGVYKKDKGSIHIDGRPVEITDPVHSQGLGISIIYQEFNLVNSLSAAENIYLGRFSHVKNRKEMYRQALELLGSINCRIEPPQKVAELSMSEKQMLEIAKALSFNAKIIIMDEPTTSLTNRETEALFAVIRRLREKDITVLYISHKLEEISLLCDRVTVMRDGSIIGTLPVDQMERRKMISMIAGRDLDIEYPRRNTKTGNILLKAEGLCNNKIRDISFEVRKSEILGLVGLVGSGRTELVRALFGADKLSHGRILVQGKEVSIKSPVDAKKAGMGLVTEDRKQQGLMLDFSVEQNITMASLKKLSPLGIMRKKREKMEADEYIQRLSIKTPSNQAAIVNLSGGNQQKCIIARWLETDPLLLILDEPTRGIDVGAKYEIYLIMNQIVEKGGAIIMISSELPEVLGMSDRVLVMRDGEITGEFIPAETKTEDIMSCALGC